jgi:hypothetical protein
MSTTVDRLGGDHNAPSIESRRAARRARMRRLEFWQTALLSTFIALVIAANLFIGAVVVFGSVKSQLVTHNEPTKVRTGRMTEMLLDGTFCRTIVFDNKSAETVKDKVDLCDQSGLFSGSGKSRFNWGRQ